VSVINPDEIDQICNRPCESQPVTRWPGMHGIHSPQLAPPSFWVDCEMVWKSGRNEKTAQTGSRPNMAQLQGFKGSYRREYDFCSGLESQVVIVGHSLTEICLLLHHRKGNRRTFTFGITMKLFGVCQKIVANNGSRREEKTNFCK
jgi:hypothetical protein